MADVFGGMRLRRVCVKAAWWRSIGCDEKCGFGNWALSLGWPGGGVVTWYGEAIDNGFTLTLHGEDYGH